MSRNDRMKALESTEADLRDRAQNSEIAARVMRNAGFKSLGRKYEETAAQLEADGDWARDAREHGGWAR